MQKVWSISGRSIAVSALALALTACQSMRGPEPVAQADIPTGYIGSTTGPSAIVFQDPTTFNTVVNLSRSVTSGDAGWVSFNDPTSSSTDFFAWSAEL